MFNMKVNVLLRDNEYLALEYNIRAKTLGQIISGVLNHGPTNFQPAMAEDWVLFACGEEVVEEDATLWIKIDAVEHHLEFVVRFSEGEIPF